jgi:hypothetical protein
VSALGNAVRDTGNSMRTVFRNRNLHRVNLALAGSMIGDWAYATAIAVWAYGSAARRQSGYGRPSGWRPSHSSRRSRRRCDGREAPSVAGSHTHSRGLEQLNTRRQARQWRWRESNPRPSVLSQGFSGRSLQSLFSAPAVMQTSPPTGPVTVRFPAWSRDRTRQLSLPADARHRAEGTPGLTDFGLLLRQQERSQRDWNRGPGACARAFCQPRTKPRKDGKEFARLVTWTCDDDR